MSFHHAPVLIVLMPMLAALLIPILSLWSATFGRVLRLFFLLGIFALAVANLLLTLEIGSFSYYLGGWLPPWGIEYVSDALSAGMAVLITLMSLLSAVYGSEFLTNWPDFRRSSYSSLHLLLTCGLLGMVFTGDVFNLYVFLEISALSAYAILSAGGDRAVVATFRYVLIGTIGASFYLLGIGYLYAMTGTLNMIDLAALLPHVAHSNAVLLGVAMIVVGLGIKTAIFPLHGWLPDVYTYAPPPTIGFVASVMTKVGAYVLFRFLYFIFQAEGVSTPVLAVLGWVSIVAVIWGSAMAIAQKDLRRMLAYSSVAQIGFIVMGFAIGNSMAIIGGLLHILNHAIMKGCLFFVAGGVRWKKGSCEINDLAGQAKTMPYTMGALVIAGLSMVGLPPACGFFSKWFLVKGALASGQWIFVVAIVLSSLLTAVYVFRVIESVYLRKPADEEAKRDELPAGMLAPILILAAAVIGIGLLSQVIVSEVLVNILPVGMSL